MSHTLDRLENSLAQASTSLMDSLAAAKKALEGAATSTQQEIAPLLESYDKQIVNVHELGQAIRRRIVFGQMPRERRWTVFGLYEFTEFGQMPQRFTETYSAHSALEAERMVPMGVTVAGVIEGDHIAADAVYA